MGLDTRFIPLNYLETFFIDKTTGLPLSNGWVYFYSDTNRSVLKTIYQITGTPPNYNYVALPNPCRLTGVGTFSDGIGNDIIPYAFPYQGTPDQQNQPVELYFVQVFADNSGSPGVFQWSREGIPNVSGSGNTNPDVDFKNYIPNGQFLFHTAIPPTNTTQPNEVPVGQAITVLGQGGWQFQRPSSPASTDVDIITFPRFAQYVNNPTQSPRYAVQIQNEISHADAFKQLAITWDDVNKFSSTTGQTYTFGFSAITNVGTSASITIQLIKNFGTGTATAPITTTVSTQTITNTYAFYQFTVSFGDNSADTIGPNDDDFVQLAINLPAGCNMAFTDFVLTPSNGLLLSFPTTPNGEMAYQAIAGLLPTPNHDGSDLYLPILLGKSGFIFDSSRIGKVFASTSTTLNPGELAYDGTQYQTSLYSSDGIPYSRLQSVWFNNSTNQPQYGTGDGYVTAYISGLVAGDLKQIRLTCNALGTATAAADGVTATNFVFANPVPGVATPAYSVTGYSSGTSTVLVLGNVVGAQNAAPGAGTTTFTVHNYLFDPSMTPYGYSGNYQAFTVTTVAGAALANPGGAGLYWLFSNTTTNYAMWFKFTNETPPAPAGAPTLIEVNLGSSGTNYTAAEIAGIVKEVISGQSINTIVCGAGGTVAGGSYFTFSSPSQNNYIWYKVNGVGTDPALSGKVGGMVTLLGTETDTQVAAATQKAINSLYFNVPNFQGLFLRGYDPTKIWDLDGDSRFSSVSGFNGISLGTYEYYLIQSHFHALNFLSANDAAGSTGITVHRSGSGLDSSSTGGTETRPINTNVVWTTYY